VPYYSELAQYWYQVKKGGVVPAHSIKSCIKQAVRQVVFTDVHIVGRLDVDGQSLAYTKQTLLLLAAHKMVLHWYERLAGSSVTKLIG
jgi:hypothetical protein